MLNKKLFGVSCWGNLLFWLILKAIADGKEQMATMTAEIKALVAGIKSLDKSVAEATDQRKTDLPSNKYSKLLNNPSGRMEFMDLWSFDPGPKTIY